MPVAFVQLFSIQVKRTGGGHIRKDGRHDVDLLQNCGSEQHRRGGSAGSR